MKTNTKTHLFQTRVPTAVAKTVKAKAKASGMTAAMYVRRLLMQEHHIPTPEELAEQAALAAKLAAEAEERANYKPDPPTRTVLEDGRIAYDAMSKELVPPDGVASIELGETSYNDNTGFPGLPETRLSMFGVAERFKPEAVYVSPWLALRNFYGGSINMLPIVGEIPANALEVGKPQLDYPVVGKGNVMTLVVHNVYGVQRAARVRIVGRAMPEKG